MAIIGIDFDGTCVTHEFPKIGQSIGAEKVLRELAINGHDLILFTVRSDKLEVNTKDPDIHQEADNYLTQAVNWFKENRIPLFAVNENPQQKEWSLSPKPYCHLYIDDAALGCPLVVPKDENNARPYADWTAIRQMLEKKGLL